MHLPSQWLVRNGLPSPWLKKILNLSALECSIMACSEWLNFTKVEENFEIITSRMLYNGLFGMLLPSPWLKKILKLQPLECSLMACYE